MSTTFFDQFLYRRICAHFTTQLSPSQYLCNKNEKIFKPLVFSQTCMYKGFASRGSHALRLSAKVKCKTEVQKRYARAAGHIISLIYILS